MIVFVLEKEAQDGMNARTVAERLKQKPVRIRQWIKNFPGKLKREGGELDEVFLC